MGFTLNFTALGQDLEIASEGAEIATSVVGTLEIDAAMIKAGQPASATIPPLGGSVEGVAGKFTGSITFTPNEAAVAPAPVAAETAAETVEATPPV